MGEACCQFWNFQWVPRRVPVSSRDVWVRGGYSAVAVAAAAAIAAAAATVAAAAVVAATHLAHTGAYYGGQHSTCSFREHDLQKLPN